MAHGERFATVAEENSELELLVNYLASIPPGSIADPKDVANLLSHCWYVFDGSDNTSMHAYKLGRMERVIWNPPTLEFTIERHGGTVLGSSRAELQGWTVNLAEKSACCGIVGRRQIQPMQARLGVRPLADDIATHVVAHNHDPRLKWYADGRVRVLMGRILPESSAVKQTLAARRKRFRAALEARLETAGWSKCGVNTYRRAT
jgi:hypothetical protein